MKRVSNSPKKATIKIDLLISILDLSEWLVPVLKDIDDNNYKDIESG